MSAARCKSEDDAVKYQPRDTRVWARQVAVRARPQWVAANDEKLLRTSAA